MNRNMLKDMHPGDSERVRNAILHFRSEDCRLDVVYRLKKKDGSGYKVIHMLGDDI